MVVLALVNLVDQIDIAILRGVLPILEDEWSLSDLQLGLLGFAFVFVNAIATIPAGWLADHARRTRLIGWTLLSWSGLIALSATAVNYVNLLGARAVMGIGQAVDDPASTSLLGDYYPARLRARAFSLQQVSLFVGGGIGLALGGFVGETLGWRWAFALVGMPGSVVAVLVFRLREPVRGEADLPEGAPSRHPTSTSPSGYRSPTFARQARDRARRRAADDLRHPDDALHPRRGGGPALHGVGHRLLAGRVPRALLGHERERGHRLHRGGARPRRRDRHLLGGDRVRPPPRPGRRAGASCSWCGRRWPAPSSSSSPSPSAPCRSASCLQFFGVLAAAGRRARPAGVDARRRPRRVPRRGRVGLRAHRHRLRHRPGPAARRRSCPTSRRSSARSTSSSRR